MRLSRLWSKVRRDRDIDAQTPDDVRVEWLSAYLDDELPPAEAAAVRAEIDADPALAQTLEELRSVRTMLGALGELRAPRAFTIEAPAPRRQGLPRLELAARIGAAVAALAFVAVASTDLAGLGDDDPDTVAERSELTVNADTGGATDGAALGEDDGDDASAAALAPSIDDGDDSAASPAGSDADSAFSDDDSGAESVSEPTETLELATAVTGTGGSDAARVATPSDDDLEATTADDVQDGDIPGSDPAADSTPEPAAVASGDAGGGDDGSSEGASPPDRTTGVVPPNTGDEDATAGGSPDVDGTAVADAGEDTSGDTPGDGEAGSEETAPTSPPTAGEPSGAGDDSAGVGAGDTAEGPVTAEARSDDDAGVVPSSVPDSPVELAVEMQTDEGTDVFRVIEAGLLLAAAVLGALVIGQWTLRRRSA